MPQTNLRSEITTCAYHSLVTSRSGQIWLSIVLLRVRNSLMTLCFYAIVYPQGYHIVCVWKHLIRIQLFPEAELLPYSVGVAVILTKGSSKGNRQVAKLCYRHLLVHTTNMYKLAESISKDTVGERLLPNQKNRTTGLLPKFHEILL